MAGQTLEICVVSKLALVKFNQKKRSHAVSVLVEAQLRARNSREPSQGF